MPPPLVELKGVTKTFGGVTALQDVDLTIEAGQVLGLVGENGAGKSTLIKILAGIYHDFVGDLRLNGRPVRFSSPQDAQRHGIATIFQELTLVPELSVSENIFLGREPTNALGIVRFDEMARKSRDILEQLGARIDPATPAKFLSVAQQQLVEIAKALMIEARVVIMDEPTSALTHHEVERLFDIVRKLRARGIAIVYVSHRLEEIFGICDHLTALRDGRNAGAAPISDLTQSRVVDMMVGRELGALHPDRSGTSGELLLTVRNLNQPGVLKNIEFDLHAGEILGFAGLVGAGRTEVARALIGAVADATGTVTLLGREMPLPRNPTEAQQRGFAYLPEDRKREGVFLGQSVRLNTTLAILDRLAPRGWISRRDEEEVLAAAIAQTQAKLADPDDPIETLSGGNQQKILFGRLAATSAKVLILDEPTRGVDVGAKFEIYTLIRKLAQQGRGIILISSELPEVLGLADRIALMRDGALIGVLDGAAASSNTVMERLVSERPL